MYTEYNHSAAKLTAELQLLLLQVSGHNGNKLFTVFTIFQLTRTTHRSNIHTVFQKKLQSRHAESRLIHISINRWEKTAAKTRSHCTPEHFAQQKGLFLIFMSKLDAIHDSNLSTVFLQGNRNRMGCTNSSVEGTDIETDTSMLSLDKHGNFTIGCAT